MNILVHNQKIKPENKNYILDTFSEMRKHAMKIFCLPVFCERLKTHQLWKDDMQCITPELLSSSEIHAAISLGGDGTILQLVALLDGHTLPIMGINLGRMGFLASIEKTIITQAIEMLADGEYVIDRRSMLNLNCTRPLFEDNPFALNDMAIFKRDTSSMITVHVYIDDKFFSTYWADGIIVSTPTGSTGYSLSCGGPIIFPNSDSFVITPIAPHNLSVRSVVIPDHSKLRFTMEGRAESFLCTLDSRYESVTENDTITIKKSDRETQLIRLHDMDFSKTIRSKLHWGIDRRN